MKDSIINDGKTYGKYHFLTVIMIAAFATAFFCFRITDEGVTLSGDNSNPALTALLWFGLVVCISFIDKIEARFGKPHLAFYILGGLCSFLFASITMGGAFFVQEKSVQPTVLFGSGASTLKSLAALLGGCFLYWFLIKGVYLLCRSLAKDETNQSGIWYERIIDGKHPMFFCYLIILICWMPQIILRYPGAMCIDAWKSLYHYWNPDQWTSQHPVLYTLILGKFADFGISVNHIEAGVFVVVLGQVGFQIFAMAHTIAVMKKYNIQNKWRMITLFFYAFLPLFSAFATTLVIDAGYCAAFLLLITEMVQCLYDAKSFIISPKHWVLTGVAVCGMFLRYNGWYILLVIVGGLFVWGTISAIQKKVKIGYVLLILCLFIAPTGLMQRYTTHLTERHVVHDVSQRAKNAMLIQQIARCVVEHPESFTESDKQVLGEVIHLPFEEISEKYSPYSFDSLKGKYNLSLSKEQRRAFRQLWVKMLQEHPWTCMNATMHQNYFMFSIFASNNRYYSGFRQGIKSSMWNYSDLYTITDQKKHVLELVTDYYKMYSCIPVLSLFVNQAIYTVILAALVLISLVYGKRRNLVLYLPLLGTVGIVLIGPACLNHARYTYPLAYTMPLLVGVASVYFKSTLGNHNDQFETDISG